MGGDVFNIYIYNCHCLHLLFLIVFLPYIIAVSSSFADKRSCRRQFGEIFDFPFVRCYMTRRARQQSCQRVRGRAEKLTTTTHEKTFYTFNTFSFNFSIPQFDKNLLRCFIWTFNTEFIIYFICEIPNPKF